MSAKPQTPSAPVERLTHDLRTAFPNLDAVRLNSHRADRQIGRSTALENGSARRYDVTTTSLRLRPLGARASSEARAFLWAGNGTIACVDGFNPHCGVPGVVPALVCTIHTHE